LRLQAGDELAAVEQKPVGALIIEEFHEGERADD